MQLKKEFTAIRIIILVILCSLNTSAAIAQQSKYYTINTDGSLIYKPDEKGNIIPDFSRVGYHMGDRELPEIKVAKKVSPATIGSSQQIIQKAIDEVALMKPDKNGFRGAVLLKKGTYKISGNLTIKTSGIVLRGEGNDENGTKLVATGKSRRTLIQVSGDGNPREIKGTRTKVTDEYVPVGQFFVNVEKPKNFKVGDEIIIYRPGTTNWIQDLQMDKIIERPGTLQWQASGYNLTFERKITAIKGNQIFINQPIIMPLEKKYGGAEVYKFTFSGRIEEVGIEQILFESEYANETDEEHSWKAIDFDKVDNGWVRNVTSKYFANSCVNLSKDARYITVTDSKCLDAKSIITGGRRYSFNVNGSFNLVKNCETTEGRHDYVSGAKTMGPNVFYNCKASNTHADIGPHHRWSAGALYDNIVTDGEINIQDRGNYGTGHGWVGTTQVIWNCTVKRAAVQTPWVSGKNYCIGLVGEKYKGRLEGKPDGEWESLGKHVMPVSLYLNQLKARKEKD
ncbi:MAG: hypothetical protein H7098_02650 [Oligoflexus sp.]|nr:hypothetical protein [Pseudopedobacter sp.]